MPPRHRKSAMKVRDGQVLRKNNWVADRGDIHRRTQREIRIERRDPGGGHRHLLTVADLRRFLDLLPDWDEVSIGLDAIVLDHWQWDHIGWHMPGVVAICAWERELWQSDVPPEAIDKNKTMFDLLDVETVPSKDGFELRWTEEQARAFQLLDVLPHELGHHHDRMTTRSQRSAARGEPYAEQYALRVMETVWPRYGEHFPL